MPKSPVRVEALVSDVGRVPHYRIDQWQLNAWRKAQEVALHQPRLGWTDPRIGKPTGVRSVVELTTKDLLARVRLTQAQITETDIRGRQEDEAAEARIENCLGWSANRPSDEMGSHRGRGVEGAEFFPACGGESPGGFVHDGPSYDVLRTSPARTSEGHRAVRSRNPASARKLVSVPARGEERTQPPPTGQRPNLRQCLMRGVRLGRKDLAISVLVGRARRVSREHEVPAAHRALPIGLFDAFVLSAFWRVVSRGRHARQERNGRLGNDLGGASPPKLCRRIGPQMDPKLPVRIGHRTTTRPAKADLPSSRGDRI